MPFIDGQKELKWWGRWQRFHSCPIHVFPFISTPLSVNSDLHYLISHRIHMYNKNRNCRQTQQWQLISGFYFDISRSCVYIFKCILFSNVLNTGSYCFTWVSGNVCLCFHMWWQGVSSTQHGHPLTVAGVFDPIIESECLLIFWHWEGNRQSYSSNVQWQRTAGGMGFDSALYNSLAIPWYFNGWMLSRCHLFCQNNSVDSISFF